MNVKVDLWLKLHVHTVTTIPKFTWTTRTCKNNLFVEQYENNKLTNGIGKNEWIFYESIDQWWHPSLT